MKEYIVTSGIILKTSNLGEYDKRLVVLTENHGKITIFARGVRRVNSKFMAAASPFVFGNFKIFPGREAYSLMDVSVTNFFDVLRQDFDISCLGMYFLEIADYYTRENNDDILMLKLLYVALRALEKIAQNSAGFTPELVRYIYEIKAICVNGEFPGISDKLKLSAEAKGVIIHIVNSPVEKLYTFTVADNILTELKHAATYYRNLCMGVAFKSLDMLEIG